MEIPDRSDCENTLFFFYLYPQCIMYLIVDKLRLCGLRTLVHCLSRLTVRLTP